MPQHSTQEGNFSPNITTQCVYIGIAMPQSENVLFFAPEDIAMLSILSQVLYDIY